jgi:hypothetical protein
VLPEPSHSKTGLFLPEKKKNAKFCYALYAGGKDVLLYILY